MSLSSPYNASYNVTMPDLHDCLVSQLYCTDLNVESPAVQEAIKITEAVKFKKQLLYMIKSLPKYLINSLR